MCDGRGGGLGSGAAGTHSELWVRNLGIRDESVQVHCVFAEKKLNFNDAQTPETNPGISYANLWISAENVLKDRGFRV